MSLAAVGNLIAHSGQQRERTPIRKIRVQLAVNAEDDVSLLAPMIGDVAGRVVDHADADVAELARPPRCRPGLARMTRRLDVGPVGSAARNVDDAHRSLALDVAGAAALLLTVPDAVTEPN